MPGRGSVEAPQFGVVRSGRLAGEVAVISGASRGIGRAIAAAFVAEGADLSLLATNGPLLDEATRALSTGGARVVNHVVDVADPDACQRAVDDTLESLGQVNVLVNSASIYMARLFMDYEPADFERLFRVNVMGAVHLMQAVTPHMTALGRGKIVNISSTAGKSASRARSAYTVSKHALIGLTRSAAVDLASSGIMVNAICPGAVKTDMLEELINQRAAIDGMAPEAVRTSMMAAPALKRFVEPEEVAALAVYLASTESDGMTGQSIALDGGTTFA
jgi:3-hydroxybutyrate dehydrogenase